MAFMASSTLYESWKDAENESVGLHPRPHSFLRAQLSCSEDIVRLRANMPSLMSEAVRANLHLHTRLPRSRSDSDT